MCVLAFAWEMHPRWRLVLVGNRDELHARPSAPLARWAQPPDLYAGRDLEAGGTWMGATSGGRAAVVTNVRDPARVHEGISRGLLVTDFLRATLDVSGYVATLQGQAARYRPFNLLLFDASAGGFVSNSPVPRGCGIEPGVHGLSNGDLDAPWPKVKRVTAALREWAASGNTAFEPLFAALADTRTAPDDALPDTGVGLAMERVLSPVFVRSTRYGTRATTLIALARDGSGCMVEQRFGPDGVASGRTALAWPD